MFSSSDINKIKNIDSKNNFELVLQSYYSKNFKSCILLLYNLVVNDLYSKLVLMDENNYVNCRSELETIETILKEGNESKYSVVEEKIFETYISKKILNHSTIDLLSYFKKIRNKCAHPFFFKENDYTPSGDEVYLFINKLYNDILIVDAFFKNPYEVMKGDIETYQFPDFESLMMGISSISKDTEKVRKYFEKKYYRYMTDNNYIKLFRSLMDLSIAKNTDEILKNQYKHFLLLNSLLEYLSYNGKLSKLSHQYGWQKLEEKNIYDDINKKLEDQQCFSLTYLLIVLKKNHTFVEELKDNNEIIYEMIEKSIYRHSYLFNEFWMIFDRDINNAATKISDNLWCNDYYQIIDSLKFLIDRDILINLIEKMFAKLPNSDGYNIADSCVELLINILKQYNPKIEKEQLENIFNILNSNRQIYDRRRSRRDNQIKEIYSLGYDLSEYDNLKIESGDLDA